MFDGMIRRELSAYFDDASILKINNFSKEKSYIMNNQSIIIDSENFLIGSTGEK